MNLFLRIVGQRRDGYHELQTVFRLLDWGDQIHLRPRADGRIVRHGGDTAAIPESDDLLLKAAKLLQSVSKSEKGVDLYATKLIPAGAGFGGGSSDAATVLVALNHVWQVGLGTTRLAALGLELGADVPVFVHGQNAWAEGVGERLTPIALPQAWYVVVDPGVHVATGELFQSPELTREAPPATMLDFVSGVALGNAFEPVLRRLQPAVDAALRALSQHGQASLTGTGSGCFLQFSTRDEAVAVQARLPRDLRSWVAAGATRSPLLAAVERYAQVH